MDICMTLLRSIMIAFSVAYIVDLSGLMGKLNRVAFRALYGGKMPLNGWYIPLVGCSVCLTFWVVLIYGFFNLPFVLAVANACLWSYLTPIISDLLKVLRIKVLDKVNA